MAEALRLAASGMNTTTPNPRVGCLLVQQNEIVGRGWHRAAGEPHAEINALRDAGERARGATAYVTLEPCAHHGRTPPCCEALIDAGVGRVVIAMQDPNPKVAGGGIAALNAAGISTTVGVLEPEAEALNRGFIKRMRSGKPWVTVKLAMSLDGRTAMASGESQWITGAAARADVQRLRARSCAIVTGAGTVAVDNPRLTVRALQSESELMRQPLRVVLDAQGKLPADAAVFTEGGACLRIVGPSASTATASNVETLVMATDESGRIDLPELLNELAKREVNELMVEAGPTLSGEFLSQGLVDEIVIYMAATLLGSAARPLFELPLAQMNEQMRLQIKAITAVGDDWRIVASPEH